MRVLLFALAATCSVVSLTAQQRAISDSDLFAFRWVASPQVSPDGRQAAYVLVTVYAKHDGYETSLWLVNTDGASPPRRNANRSLSEIARCCAVSDTTLQMAEIGRASCRERV